MPDKMSKEKIDLLRAYGAEVVVAPTDVAPESPQSYYRVADRLTEEIPGAFQPNQYANPANPETHYLRTGPELWRQSGGRITHLVAGVGTGGTITGIGRYLKEQNPADPGHRRRPGRLDLLRRRGAPVPRRGRGGGLLAADVRSVELVDRYVRVIDRDSFLTTRQLVRDRGPAGRRLVRHGAVRGADRRARARRPRTRWSRSSCPTAGGPYLSKVYNDAWMRQYGFLEAPGRAHGRRRPAGQARGGGDPAARDRRHPPARARRDRAAARASREPAAGGVQPRSGHAVVGSIGERGLLRRAADDPERAERPDRRRDGAAVPRRVHDRPGARGGRAALRRGPGAARHRRAASPPASSRAPTCSSPWSHERDSPRTRASPRAPCTPACEPDPHYGSIVPAIHQTSTYVQPAPGEFVGDYDYSRAANPTRRALEDALGELEGGHGTAFGSGMAAEHALITAVCAAGDHIVLPERPLRRHLPPRRQGPQPLGPRATRWSTSATSTPSRRRSGPNTKLIWVETPTNPTLNVIDVAAVIERQGRTPWWPSTTRSPRRSTSVRSSSGPTRWSTRPRSTWAGTPTRSAAR